MPQNIVSNDLAIAPPVSRPVIVVLAPITSETRPHCQFDALRTYRQEVLEIMRPGRFLSSSVVAGRRIPRAWIWSSWSVERKGPEVVARENDRPGNFLGFISTALWLPREEQPAIVLGIVYVRLCLFL